MSKHIALSAAVLAALLATAGCTGHDSPGDSPSPVATPVVVQPPATPSPTVTDLPPPVQAQLPAPEATQDPVTPSTSVKDTTRPVVPSPRVTPTTPTALPTRPAQAPSSPVKPSPSATAPVPVPAGNSLRINGWSHGYVTAHSQAALDRCNVVEWDPGWFAGHDWCGYAFWASLPVGTTITLTGRSAGTYTVTHRVYLPYQGGERPALPAYDLALQTCKGSGTQLILATKTG